MAYPGKHRPRRRELSLQLIASATAWTSFEEKSGKVPDFFRQVAVTNKFVGLTDPVHHRATPMLLAGLQGRVGIGNASVAANRQQFVLVKTTVTPVQVSRPTSHIDLR